MVTASVNLPYALWEKSHRYKINRSAVARQAIAKECERIEKEIGASSRQASAPTTPTNGGE